MEKLGGAEENWPPAFLASSFGPMLKNVWRYLRLSWSVAAAPVSAELMSVSTSANQPAMFFPSHPPLVVPPLTSKMSVIAPWAMGTREYTIKRTCASRVTAEGREGYIGHVWAYDSREVVGITLSLELVEKHAQLGLRLRDHISELIKLRGPA